MALNVVSNQNTQPKGPLLTLTPKAIHMVREGMAAEKLEGHGLRVGVVGGGCSGFSYSLDFDKDAKDGDITWEVDGLKIFVDPVSAPHLADVNIDYVAMGLQSGFKFGNPNAAKTCGCGTSFSP